MLQGQIAADGGGCWSAALVNISGIPAEYSDAARIAGAGAGCERDYDALTPPQPWVIRAKAPSFRSNKAEHRLPRSRSAAYRCLRIDAELSQHQTCVLRGNRARVASELSGVLRMSVETSRCGECGDVVLSSFLKTHAFYVHDEGADQHKTAKVRTNPRKRTSPSSLNGEFIADLSRLALPQPATQTTEKDEGKGPRSYFSNREGVGPSVCEEQAPLLPGKCEPDAVFDAKELHGKSSSFLDPVSKHRKSSRTARKVAKAAEKERVKKLLHLRKMRKQQARKRLKRSVNTLLSPAAQSKLHNGPRIKSRLSPGLKPLLSRAPGSGSMWSGSPGRWVTLVRG